MTMKKMIALIGLIALLIAALIPHAAFTEDKDAVLLARVIYALAREDSYDAKLAIGTVAMNRVDSPWFSPTLGGVLNEQHQFPYGSRYDDESLSAAHAVLAGKRTLKSNVVYYQSAAASAPRQEAPVKTVGGFNFYAG